MNKPHIPNNRIWLNIVRMGMLCALLLINIIQYPVVSFLYRQNCLRKQNIIPNKSITIYHYTHLDAWEKIQEGSYKSSGRPGLGTNQRIGHDDMEAWSTAVVFALLEPEPENWTANSYFKKIWEFLRHDMGTLLLEIEVNLEEDNIFVADRGFMQGFLSEQKAGIPEKYLFDSRAAAERAYMQSKLPLREYLERQDELNYSLPEVIITDNIPLKKIKISPSQPLMNEYSKGYKEPVNTSSFPLQKFQKLPKPISSSI